MKIGTDRNLEDPIGFGTSPVQDSVQQHRESMLFCSIFVQTKGSFFQASGFCIPAIGVCCFADSQGAKIFTFQAIAPKSPGALDPLWMGGKGSDDAAKELGNPEKMLLFQVQLEVLV